MDTFQESDTHDRSNLNIVAVESFETTPHNQETSLTVANLSVSRAELLVGRRHLAEQRTQTRLIEINAAAQLTRDRLKQKHVINTKVSSITTDLILQMTKTRRTPQEIGFLKRQMTSKYCPLSSVRTNLKVVVPEGNKANEGETENEDETLQSADGPKQLDDIIN